MPPIHSAELKPYWQTTDGKTVRLYHGDVLKTLRRMKSKSIHCVVTSPPYWGLRDYGADKQFEIGSEKSPDCLGWARGVNCAADDWANGCFICRMRLVMKEVHRVLRDDGTAWVNFGDSYSTNGTRQGNARSEFNERPASKVGSGYRPTHGYGLANGNLVGVPWRFALACQADGWVLRQDIIWHKLSPMPESVRNRCTKAHEYVFLLVKKRGYYYDAEAIKQQGNNIPHTPGWSMSMSDRNDRQVDNESNVREWGEQGLSNKRSVWSLSSQGYPGAHFATFPMKLIEPMIKAGTSEAGCCSDCGAPHRRVTEETKLTRERPNDYVKRTGENGTGNSCANTVAGVEVRTVGWEAACDCCSSIEPCRVLDPFGGSATTAAVCIDLGRYSTLIELNESYIKNNQIPRIAGELESRSALQHLDPGRKVERVNKGKSLTFKR